MRESKGTSLRYLPTLFGDGGTAGLTDGQLLERFAGRDGIAAELAFAAIVERHGGMVFHACRGLLRDENDAGRAFPGDVPDARPQGQVALGGRLDRALAPSRRLPLGGEGPSLGGGSSSAAAGRPESEDR